MEEEKKRTMRPPREAPSGRGLQELERDAGGRLGVGPDADAERAGAGRVARDAERPEGLDGLVEVVHFDGDVLDAPGVVASEPRRPVLGPLVLQELDLDLAAAVERRGRDAAAAAPALPD